MVPPPLAPGGLVALVSPSWAGPGVFPAVHERGVAVLTRTFDVRVREYPTTREVGASPRDRARDLMSAFADDEVGAVMATIGGDDQIRVLAHLDGDRLAASPKRFFGYSDNTNLLAFLVAHGVAGFHGGSTMVHLARAGGPHAVSLASLGWALFGGGEHEIVPQPSFSDESPHWQDLATLAEPTATTDDPGWVWSGPARVVSGPTWGGNLEVLMWQLGVGRWIRDPPAYAGGVLLLETSEEMPSAVEVERALRVLGERGLLAQFAAVVVAKPKAWSHDRRTTADERARYRDDQRAVVLAALGVYHPGAVVVVGPDIGHTDPQYVVPYGGVMTVDAVARRLTAQY